MNKYILEVCVDSIESATAAINGGADRLELCANLVIGGTTPSICLFQRIKEISETPIHVLIRPRYGDFCYTQNEINIMTDEIKMYKGVGVDGVVIGALNPDGDLDMANMLKLCNTAKPMSITLHRAFDVCSNPYEVLMQANDLGVNTILTSGQKDKCIDGIDLINKLTDNQVDIMIGGGVNVDVIRKFISETKVTSFHLSGKMKIDSKMFYRNLDVCMGIASMDEYELWYTCSEKVKEAKKVFER